MRNQSTNAEVLLWNILKGKKLGYRFNRQKPIDKYIVDFYCFKLSLVIEVDGYSHYFESVQRKDETKEAKLKELGLTVLRIEDEEINSDIDNVIATIQGTIDEIVRRNSPDPS